MNQREYFGFNSTAILENILKSEKIKNVFLLTGKNSFEVCGVQNKLFEIFRNAGCRFTRFYNFSPNPQLKDIERGANLFEREKYDCIVGIGGGSCIDVAKSIKLFHHEKTEEKVLLIAIPTTAGSGSEATHFIVYYIGKEKQSKGNPKLTLPDYVICDPQLTMSLPKRITASTGMDALTHAIESYWCINSTDESKKLSSKAIKLILNSLEEAVNSPSERSRENMMKAANLAGKAINITKTTACHSISYPITSYFNIPHGHAVALSLAEMLFYNLNCDNETCNDKRGMKYVKRTINEITDLIGEDNPYDTKNRIQNLIQNIGLETKLSRLGLKETDVDRIIEEGFNPERIKNNPRILKKEDLRKFLKDIY